jgi:hypothetical protein
MFSLKSMTKLEALTWPHNHSLEKNQVPRELALIAIFLACLLVQWYSYGGSWTWVTLLPILNGILKLLFAFVFVFLHMCTNNSFHLIIKILYIQFSSVFLPILETLLVQGFILNGDLQFSKFLKNTICIGLCKLKCTEKRFIPLTPLHFSLSLSPIKEFKGRPEAATWIVLYHTSFRNYKAISLQVPSLLSILLGGNWERWVANSVAPACNGRGGGHEQEISNAGR